jgi:hypothetical protein
MRAPTRRCPAHFPLALSALQPGRQLLLHCRLACVLPLPSPDHEAPQRLPVLPAMAEARPFDAWRTFWRHGIAQLVAPIDVLAIRRLFALYDARERTWRLFLKNPLTPGSKGQLTMHPLGCLRSPSMAAWSGSSEG